MMVTIGYALAADSQPAAALLDGARHAEAAGFAYAVLAEPDQSWIEHHGTSSLVWTMLAGLLPVSARLELVAGVTGPTTHLHPALLAQAAATSALLLPKRFMLGVGSVAYLNEQMVVDGWPPYHVRAELLEVAVAVIRQRWRWSRQRHEEKSGTNRCASVTGPAAEPPPILIAAGCPHAAALAGRIGDALITATPDPELVASFAAAGGSAKPRYVQTTVDWTPANGGRAGRPDAERHIADIQRCVDAGYNHVHIRHVGSDHGGFLRFYAREVLPRFA